jgi:hypothetical protein
MVTSSLQTRFYILPQEELACAIRVDISLSRELNDDRLLPRYVKEPKTVQDLGVNLDIRYIPATDPLAG